MTEQLTEEERGCVLSGNHVPGIIRKTLRIIDAQAARVEELEKLEAWAKSRTWPDECTPAERKVLYAFGEADMGLSHESTGNQLYMTGMSMGRIARAELARRAEKDLPL
jgi:hypothetical protein